MKNALRRTGSAILSLIPRTRAAAYAAGILPSRSLGRPVLSVGNLSVGGTGKTPFTIHLAEMIADRFDRFPVILSRGYRSSAESSSRMVNPRGRGIECSPGECGDEPFLMARKLTFALVIAGRDRVASSRLVPAVDLPRAVFILDDGFQHLKVRRDLDLVLVDATRPPAKDALFPFGRLREPPSALRRADAVVITRSHLSSTAVEEIRRQVLDINPDCRIFTFGQSLETAAGPKGTPSSVPISSLQGAPVAVLAAIGNPDQFIRDLQNAGLKIVRRYLFRDHHPFTRREIDRIAAECSRDDINTIVTTEKDLVRLERLKLPEGLFLAAQLTLREDPPGRFESWIRSRFPQWGDDR